VKFKSVEYIFSVVAGKIEKFMLGLVPVNKTFETMGDGGKSSVSNRPRFVKLTVERILNLLMKRFIVIEVGQTKMGIMFHIFLGNMNP
jgi:hypothetical protein